MAAAKKKVDEKNLKLLREVVVLPHNKQCFDCNQRGPTYVNMTVGSYICTTCSGILRGINPPHRVKSISMSSFTPEEIDFLMCRGNEFSKQVWLGLFDSRQNSDAESKDENKRRDFMMQKYEKKRWYVTPTEAMHEVAKKQNTVVPKTETKSFRSLPKSSMVLPNTTQPVTTKTSTESSFGFLNTTAAATQPTTSAQASQVSVSKGLDLLSDLGSDPFGSSQMSNTNFGGNSQSATQQPQLFSQTQPSGLSVSQSQPSGLSVSQSQPSGLPVNQSQPSGFADFASFGSQPTSNLQHQQQAAADNPSQFSSSAFPNLSAAPSVSKPMTFPVTSGGDRYAAFANLENNSEATSGPVQWGGSVFGNSNGDVSSSKSIWGGSSSNDQGQGLSSSASAHALGSFGSQMNANQSMSAASHTNQAPNPFNNAFGTSFSNSAPPAQSGNPFMASAAPVTTAASSNFGAPFSNFGNFPSTAPVSNQAQSSQMNNFGTGLPTQFAINGNQPQAGWQQNQPPTMNNMQQFSNSQPSNFASMQTLPANQPPNFAANQNFNSTFGSNNAAQNTALSWPAQPPTSNPNPFMGVVNQAAVPPKPGSTNPFL